MNKNKLQTVLAALAGRTPISAKMYQRLLVIATILASVVFIFLVFQILTEPSAETKYGISSWITPENMTPRFGIVLDEDALVFVLVRAGDKPENCPRVPMTRVSEPLKDRSYQEYRIETKMITASIVINRDLLFITLTSMTGQVETLILHRAGTNPRQSHQAPKII